MKVNKICVKSMCTVLMAVLLTGCSGEQSSAIPEAYPDLYEAVYQREAAAILPFTDNGNELVARQAWRALISTPVDSVQISALTERVVESGYREAWTALSVQTIQADHLRMLEGFWESRPELRAGISLVLGRQGDMQSLEFMKSRMEAVKASDFEFEGALATGRLIGRHGTDEQHEKLVVEYAASLDNAGIQRAWLYGFYRYGQEFKSPESTELLKNSYADLSSPLARQYWLGLIIRNDGPAFLDGFTGKQLRALNTQTAVEVLQKISAYPPEQVYSDIYTSLVLHENPVVREQSLNILARNGQQNEATDVLIENEIIRNENLWESLRLSGILAHSSPGDFSDLSAELSEKGDYLVIKELAIRKKILDASSFYDEIVRVSNSENRREVLFAVQALNSWWPSLPEEDKNKVGEENVRDFLFRVLDRGDRSITYSTGTLLNGTDLLKAEDYPRIEKILSRFRLPEDVEVYQALSQVLYSNYKDQAEPLIDSLAQKGNLALNRSLNNDGWDVPLPDAVSVVFRPINWERLAELESEPVWVLETTKGIIRLKMDVLRAPSTISGMDSLIVNGHYDGVAFHRVVPNFVVQGGDVETGDGFGGPDYVVPTEASEEHYYRGKAGIASAGTDTEGSQYFIMHQWKPHLNTGYTIFGEVIEGMGVTDRLLVGDKVMRSYWE